MSTSNKARTLPGKTGISGTRGGPPAASLAVARAAAFALPLAFVWSGIPGWSSEARAAPVPHVASEAPRTAKPLRLEAALALPQPLQLGLERGETEVLRSFVTVGAFGIPAAARGFLIYGVQAGLRWHPWREGFFASIGLGYQRIRASAALSALVVEGERLADAAVLRGASVFVTPMVGYRWQLTPRLTLATELGAQLPVASTGDMYLYNDATGENSDNSESLRVDSRNTISRLTRLPLPQLTLLRLSWAL